MVSCPKTYYQDKCQTYFSLYFLLRVYRFRSYIFVFSAFWVFMVWNEGSIFIPLHINPELSPTTEKMFLIAHSWQSYQRLTDYVCESLFWALCFVVLVSVYIFMLIAYCLDYCSLLISFEIQVSDTSSLIPPPLKLLLLLRIFVLAPTQMLKSCFLFLWNMSLGFG